MKYLNLGCGQRFHSAWTNLDFRSTGPNVIAHDLTQGIPFPDSSFDVIYHSHILEHFSKSKAKFFVNECCRVLRPQGILRVAVPDLEQIIRAYLDSLEKAQTGCLDAAKNYDWLLLELFDQVARNNSGGEMAAYLFQEHIPNKDFVLERLGAEARSLIEASQRQCDVNHSREFILKKGLRSLLDFFRESGKRRDFFLKKILSAAEYDAFQVGEFRRQGEIHQWMYDSYSLAKLLSDCGFSEVTRRNATDSSVPDWSKFNLDSEVDGTIYKPDSIFMEAVKTEPSALINGS